MGKAFFPYYRILHSYYPYTKPENPLSNEILVFDPFFQLFNATISISINKYYEVLCFNKFSSFSIFKNNILEDIATYTEIVFTVNISLEKFKEIWQTTIQLYRIVIFRLQSHLNDFMKLLVISAWFIIPFTVQGKEVNDMKRINTKQFCLLINNICVLQTSPNF